MLFLIEYDRSSGQTIALRHFEDAQQQLADTERLKLELLLNRQGLEREVVLLEASSEEGLRATHRRYFEDLTGLANNPPR